MERTGLIREATPGDFQALVALEEIGFPIDRFSDGQVRHMLTRARAATLVCEMDGRIQGSAVMLWRKNGLTGHLASIATHPDARGLGLGRRLLEACEEAAAHRGCRRIFLEVRVDNTLAIAFYQRHGYEVVGRQSNYYADGQGALHMIKVLDSPAAPEVRLAVPYVPRSRAFTGGPACMLMAMKLFAPGLAIDESLEMALWEQTALGPAESSLGGCPPVGMALTARRRGYAVKALIPGRIEPISPAARDVMARANLVDVWREARSAGMPLRRVDCIFADVAAALRAGLVPLLVLDAHRLGRAGAPHWVVATGFDESHLFVHDPHESSLLGQEPAARDIPIPVAALDGDRPAIGMSAVFIGRPAV